MPINDFLVPEEQIKFIGKQEVEYSNRKYKLCITDKRILLYKKSGFLNKCEDIICEKIDRLEGLEYKEKVGLFNLAKITIKGGIKIEIKGNSEEVKKIFQLLECLKYMKQK